MELTTDKKTTVTHASEARFGEFKPIVGSTGTTLYILRQSEDYPGSMYSLSRSGLMPLTYQELFLRLMKDEKLKELLKGKRFWIAGEGLDEYGIFTINKKGKNKGELRKITKDEEKFSVEQVVHIWSGDLPLSVYVASDKYYDEGFKIARFQLYASIGPNMPASVVVGVPADRFAVAPKNNAHPNVPAHLLRKAKEQVIQLRTTAKPGATAAIEEVLNSL